MTGHEPSHQSIWTPPDGPMGAAQLDWHREKYDPKLSTSAMARAARRRKERNNQRRGDARVSHPIPSLRFNGSLPTAPTTATATCAAN
ncbi:hypothetical protein BHM03_00059070 [Ensete ventricosum]|nr:hypothetical protein BHM03_00059070 [Ensete ventricosum]